MARRHNTLAVVTRKLEDVVSTMQGPALYFSALYDNKTHIDILSEALHQVIDHHNKVLGSFSVTNVDGQYMLGVVVYEDHAAEKRDHEKGVIYERSSF